MRFISCNNRQNRRQHGKVAVPDKLSKLVHESDSSFQAGYPNFFATSIADMSACSDPPPVYEMVEKIRAAPLLPPRRHQAQQMSAKQSQIVADKPQRETQTAWVSALQLDNPYASLGQQQHNRSVITLRDEAQRPSEVTDYAIARSINQGAALCDRVAARLSTVLCMLDDGQAYDGDINALFSRWEAEDQRSEDSRATARRPIESIQPSKNNGIINFSKSWMYANSRLPPHLLPYKVYVPTWQILCRAAEASNAVYRRPSSSHKEMYVDADWRHGTKAMAVKSVCVDEKNLIVFAIRGSKWNLVDWAVNFRPAPKEPSGFLDDAGNACHAGFLQVAKAMVKPVAARLRQLVEQNPSRAGSSLLLTGHSAGGAVASLLYMHMLSTSCRSDLIDLIGLFKRVHCVTFGAPPVSLLPLQKPNSEKSRKSIFVAFANEGDPVVRADKQYICSLGRLVAAPAPILGVVSASRQRLKCGSKPASPSTATAPRWPVPEATLSNAGRVVLLRKKPGQPFGTEAVGVTDEQLRNVIFGDPSMHDMALYKSRIDSLAFAAVTGRDEG